MAAACSVRRERDSIERTDNKGPGVNADKVEWSKVAEPQEDGYDIKVTLALAQEERQWEKPKTINPPTFCDGQVGLRLWPFGNTPNRELVPGPVEHPNLFQAEKFLKELWPKGYEQFTQLVGEVYPMTFSEHKEGTGIGSCSGHNVQRPFTIYVTHFDAFGTAESMLHEMAHIKLRCLGVQVETCSRLILNDSSELYVSPLRSFKRPMTAVVHAFYSWLHLTELDVRLAPHNRVRASLRLQRNCDWIGQMLCEIRSNVRLDRAGEAFIKPMYAWAERLLVEGRALMETV